MLACIFGHTGKTATASSNRRGGSDTDDDSAGADDADNIRWELINPLGRKNGKRVYRAARARLLREGATRIFQIGDCVTTKSNTTDIWVGHIISFFEVLTKSGMRGTSADSFRVVVRWFYQPKDIQDELDTAVNNGMIRDPLSTELFFSDYVATEGNPLECILGRAIIRSTKQGLHETKADPPRDYWKDSDKFFLCRAYYASSEPREPRPIRKLEQGELAYLLQNPCIDDLYNTSLLFRRHGHKINKDQNGNPVYHKHKPVAVKKENKIADPNANAKGKDEKKKKKQKVKKDHTEVRPMFKCRCCPELNGNGRLEAKRKNSNANSADEVYGDEIEAEAVPSKRPRTGSKDNDNDSGNNNNSVGSPSQAIEHMEAEPLNNNNSSMNIPPAANGTDPGMHMNMDVKDEDDLEELPYTPPRLAGTPERGTATGTDDLAIVEAP